MKTHLVYTLVFLAALTATAQNMPQHKHNPQLLAEVPHSYNDYLQAVKAMQESSAPPAAGLILNYYKRDSTQSHYWDGSAMNWIPSAWEKYQYDCELEVKTQVLSGDLTDNLNKTEYTYRPDGSADEELGSTWLSNLNQWLPLWFYKYSPTRNLLEAWQLFYSIDDGSITGGYRITYAYNDNDDESANSFFTWDIVTNDWAINASNTSTFDSQGRQIESVQSNLVTGVLEETDRWLYTYDAMGNNTIFLHQIKQGFLWVDSDRITSMYNANNLNTSRLVEYYINQQWQPSNLFTLSYDSNGNLLSELEQSYLAGAWENNYQELIQYYPTGETQLRTLSKWSEQISSWYMVSFDSSDTEGNRWLAIDKRGFNPLTGAYQEGERSIYTWEAGNLTSIIDDRLLPNTADAWQPLRRAYYEFDSGNLYSESILQFYQESVGDYVNVVKDIYYNNDCLAGGTESTSDGSAYPCVFQNPYTLGQPIECQGIAPGAKLAIFDTTGKLLYHQATMGNGFSIEKSLNPGLYFMQVSQGGQVVYRQKLVVL